MLCFRITITASAIDFDSRKLSVIRATISTELIEVRVAKAVFILVRAYLAVRIVETASVVSYLVDVSCVTAFDSRILQVIRATSSGGMFT